MPHRYLAPPRNRDMHLELLEEFFPLISHPLLFAHRSSELALHTLVYPGHFDHEGISRCPLNRIRESS